MTENLRELAGHVTRTSSSRTSARRSGRPCSRPTAIPFRHGRWLFMHNGFSTSFAAIKRDLALAVDESLYPEMPGRADTEILFYLALTFGLEDDPPDAVARTIGLVEACGRHRGVKYPFQGTIATTDGERMWVFRYSSEGKSRSLFSQPDVPRLGTLYPERQICRALRRCRLVVSEPIGDLPGAWNEVPEQLRRRRQGEDQLLPFTPKPPIQSPVRGIRLTGASQVSGPPGSACRPL